MLTIGLAAAEVRARAEARMTLCSVLCLRLRTRDSDSMRFGSAHLANAHLCGGPNHRSASRVSMSVLVFRCVYTSRVSMKPSLGISCGVEMRAGAASGCLLYARQGHERVQNFGYAPSDVPPRTPSSRSDARSTSAVSRGPL